MIKRSGHCLLYTSPSPRERADVNNDVERPSHHGLSAVWFQAGAHLLRHTRVRVQTFLARSAACGLRHRLAAGYAVTGVRTVTHAGGSRHKVTEFVTGVSTAVPGLAD